MKYHKFAKLTAIAFSGLLFTSCNDDDNGNNNGGARGPADSAAFAGSTISFNPTISFLANGEISYFNEEDGSSFVLAEASAPLGGSYSYAPSSSFLAGDLTFTIDGQDTETVTLTNFVNQNGNVVSFDITFNDGSKFDAIVDGVIKAAKAPNNTPGGGGGGGTPGGAENFTFDQDGNIEAGTTFSKEYLSGNKVGDPSGSPLPNYSGGQSVDFEIGDDGSLNFDGISLPFVGAADGILSWSDSDTIAVFETGDTDAPADLTITYTKIGANFSTNVDAKVFSN